MSDEQNATTGTNNKEDGQSLLTQALSTLKKRQKESALAKVNELVAKRLEHERGARLITAEIAEIQAKFDAGLL